MTVRPAVRMSQNQPIVDHDRESLTTLCSNAHECARLEWRVGESGDPAELMNSALASYGLSMPGADEGHFVTQRNHLAESICGATLFLSAAGSAAIVGAPTGAASPSPAVPDLVVAIYAHSVTTPFGSSLPLGPSGLGAFHLGEWEPSWTESEHASAVTAVRGAIARGDVY